MTLVGNFLDFAVKEHPFSGFDHMFERLPIFEIS